jgi:hypothetical protein
MESSPPFDGSFSAWTERFELPDWMPDEENPPFGVVHTGWNEGGLYLCVRANLRREPRVKPGRFWEGDSFEVFFDLRGALARDTYSEFCYHFYFLPVGNGNRTPRGGLCEPGVANQIAVADLEGLAVASVAFAQGYRLEIAIPRAVIPSFDPVNHAQIGFNYILHDAFGREQYWSAGRELATYRDPSTWGILNLVA